MKPFLSWLADVGASLLFVVIILAFILAMLLAATGCAPVRYVSGTAVPLPRVEYADDWVRAKCWAPTEDPSQACCVYSQEMERWRLICTRTGGESWDMLDDSVIEPSPGPHASLREGCAEGYDDGRVRCA